jgi:hypothetical protein
MDKTTITISHYSGQWDKSPSHKLTIVDIINLAIYSTAQQQTPDNDLPPIENIASYKKLPIAYRQLTKQRELLLVSENIADIMLIIGSV